MSPQTRRSGTHYNVTRAWIYPVRLDDGPLPEFDLGANRQLTDLHYTDLFGANSETNALRLVGAIKRALGVNTA